jgi:hypothetical protein
MDMYVSFPGESLLLTIVEGTSEPVGTREVVQQDHIILPSITASQRMLDVDKARVLATNIGNNIPKLAPVIHKG